MTQKLLQRTFVYLECQCNALVENKKVEQYIHTYVRAYMGYTYICYSGMPFQLYPYFIARLTYEKENISLSQELLWTMYECKQMCCCWCVKIFFRVLANLTNRVITNLLDIGYKMCAGFCCCFTKAPLKQMNGKLKIYQFPQLSIFFL